MASRWRLHGEVRDERLLADALLELKLAAQPIVGERGLLARIRGAARLARRRQQTQCRGDVRPQRKDARPAGPHVVAREGQADGAAGASEGGAAAAGAREPLKSAAHERALSARMLGAAVRLADAQSRDTLPSASDAPVQSKCARGVGVAVQRAIYRRRGARASGRVAG